MLPRFAQSHSIKRCQRIGTSYTCNLVWKSLWYHNKVLMYMTMVWSMLWAGGVHHRVLSCYVASLLTSKSRSSCQVQIAQSSSFAKANNGSRFSLEACSLLAQTMAFAHLLLTFPRAFGPVDGVQIPIPSDQR